MKPFFSHFQRSKVLRPVAVGMTFLMVHASVPAWAVVPKADPNAPKKLKEEKVKAIATRKLGAKEMKTLKGKLLGNPYASGSAKFDLVYKGVNMRTGDYTYSANDLSYEGGYGIPISVARSYSANCTDEGPFGVGWTLTADMRSTAGGTMKSGGAPVRNVPTNIKMRHADESDPNLSADPVKAVVVTDAEGTETTLQVDVDGVITTPPWEKNTYDAEYETVWDGSVNYEILLRNKTKTPDGTVYEYEKKGVYTGGVDPINTTSIADPEPSNVLKVTKATDRHGNETIFTYGSTPVTFSKTNGSVSENPLTRVDMPNGRFIDFEWDGDRIIEATDNERSVTYEYNNDDQLIEVTSPGGRLTRYGWGHAKDGSGSNTGDDSLLTSITDPRGLVTAISYVLDNYMYTSYKDRVIAYKVNTPDGRAAHFSPDISTTMFPPDHVSGGAIIADPGWVHEFATGTITPTLKEFSWKLTTGTGTIITTERSATTKSFLIKTYDDQTHNLITERSLYGTGYGISGNYLVKEAERSYNFMGHPLNELLSELDSSDNIVKTYQTEYAYWGEDKYFQQKAQRIKLGTSTYRYSFIDYFDSSATLGKKGQKKRIYDDKNCDYVIDTGITAPNHAISGGYAWKYQLRPDDENDFAAEFDYDSAGRTTDVWKLQKVVSGTRTYTQTKSVYSATGLAYGNAVSVIQDYGTGKINRTTETLDFDVAGRALHTRDAMGQEFETVYDGDGNTLSVTRTDCIPAKPIVTYTYGSVDGEVENGKVLSVTDELSGVVQTLSYAQSGPAIGEPLTASETDGMHAYDVTFGYDSIGNREYLTIDSPNGVTKWRYSDWITVGPGSGNIKVFSKVNKQAYISSSWVDSGEQFDYTYGGSGALLSATFAMTPQSGEDDYNSYPADTRARAVYSYDEGGRSTGIEYFWDTLNGSVYDSERIWATDSTYSHPLSLKDSVGFLEPNGAGTDWQLQRRETYEYDDSTDYLSEVDYNLGASQDVAWTYDAVGNRMSDTSNPGAFTYDNINRITASPAGSYTNDLAGNRLTGPSQAMSWDDINRMISFGINTEYRYRADGMRIVKDINGGDFTRFLYAGQLPIESLVDDGTVSTVSRNALGARGIDAVSSTVSATTSWSYPLYDCHGNEKAVLTRSGGTFATSQWRSYDVWGNVIDGNAIEGRNFVSKVGNHSDLESGLIYMGSRYYDQSLGRFCSEDVELEGDNWFKYANNVPTCASDPGGKASLWDQMQDSMARITLNLAVAFVGIALIYACKGASGVFLSVCASAAAVVCFGLFFACSSPFEGFEIILELALTAPIMKIMVKWAVTSLFALEKAKTSVAFKALAVAFAYGCACWGALLAIEHFD